MLNLNDTPEEGKEFEFYLVLDYIKTATLEEAIQRRDNQMKLGTLKDEDKEIFKVVAKYDVVKKDKSFIYSDISKIKVT